jgi:DNA-binding PadR family transcriptional regulator
VGELHSENKTILDENKIKEQFLKRLVSKFLDIIIISHFQEEQFSGYDVTEFIHKRLNILLSPGTIYSALYTMQREGLLESFQVPNKRVFKATEKGLQIRKLLRSPEEMAAFITNIMKK